MALSTSEYLGIFREGHDAGSDSRSSNPYNNGSSEFGAWDDGWQGANIDSQGGIGSYSTGPGGVNSGVSGVGGSLGGTSDIGSGFSFGRAVDMGVSDITAVPLYSIGAVVLLVASMFVAIRLVQRATSTVGRDEEGKGDPDEDGHVMYPWESESEYKERIIAEEDLFNGDSCIDQEEGVGVDNSYCFDLENYDDLFDDPENDCSLDDPLVGMSDEMIEEGLNPFEDYTETFEEPLDEYGRSADDRMGERIADELRRNGIGY